VTNRRHSASGNGTARRERVHSLAVEHPARSGSTEQPPIRDYGFLSDCHSAALVDAQGSIDWWCVPRFDSPSVLGRLLDPAAGHWLLRPEARSTSSRSYVGDTLVLRTVFHTTDGDIAVTDALALEHGARGHDIGRCSPHQLLRRVEGLSGRVPVRMELAVRMEYGRTEPHLTATTGGVVARGGPVSLTCSTSVPLRQEDGILRAGFTVGPGESVDFRLAYEPAFPGTPTTRPGEATLEDTILGWQSWSAEHTTYDGAFPDLVRRSSLVLQGLTFQPSGAVVAAATTSLPETMGGTLNFDYRYAWLRDLSLTIRSLWLAACPDEPTRLFSWFAGSAGHLRDELVQIMYGVEGERDLTEHELEHLAGYRGSSPVRVGNQAWEQEQLDVFGEVLDAAHLLRDQLGELEPATVQLLVALANRAAGSWQQPDAGMWEARDSRRHYTSSKVMCWVALDRACALAPRLGASADPSRWARERDAVRAAVLEQAWSDEAGAYAGALGSSDLDASVLLLPVVGFLPADDTRMRATVEAVARELGRGGLVRRWPDDASGFLICTYWLVECLAMAGETDRAREWFEQATGRANDLGLLSEEADPDSDELLGNFPQAFSHVGLINAAWRLGQADAMRDPIDRRAP